MSAVRLLLIPALLAPASGHAEPSEPAPRTLEVVGHGTAAAAPDLATIRIGVSVRASTPAAALDGTSGAARRIAEVAAAAGVEPRDVQTGSVSLSPVFRPNRADDGSGAPDGYAAQNSVDIRVRDLGKLGDVLRRAVEGGANRIEGLSFGLSDPRKASEDAKREAVADAFRQARLLADAAGVKLGPVRRITVTSNRGGPIGVRTMAMRAPGAAVPIEGGSLDVSADVEVAWTLDGP